MKKYVFFLLLLSTLFSPFVIQAETGDGSVSDFFNQTESIEQDEQESTDQDAVVSDPSQSSESKQPTIFGLIIRIIVVLVIIIGLIYLLLKFFNRSSNFNHQGKVLTNLGGISLGTNKSAQLVKVGDKIYLVGVGDDVSILTEITDQSVKEQLLENQQSTPMINSSLIEQFNFIRKRKPQSSEELGQADDASNDQDFASLFKGELDAMKDKREKIRVKFKEEE
ncbi:flagellar biosynthetic protein FliO [Amphibacillus indicireducens]|uniref:Flagellar protein n=1 Tax=Amphibacillus indicireducens TaxID=1076330 RepID=A0ABP7V5Y1_9BACI